MSSQAIKYKLKSYSTKNNYNHNYTILRFIQERYLYRLSISKYKDNFLLKGGALIYVYGIEEYRYTRDIDFLLTRLENSHAKMSQIFKEIGDINYPDSVEFLTEELKISDIQKEGKYKGVRIKIPSQLGNVKEQLQIDIGVGDHVTPGPQQISYPTILTEFDGPKLYAYSIENSVAEKFEAMISLGEFNSRMKDFYDVYYFLPKTSSEVLFKAITNTFKRRNTPIIENHPVFDLFFYEDKKRDKRWKVFLDKNELSELKFSFIHNRLVEYLKPIYDQLK